MNFYSMNVYEIERYIRNIESDDLLDKDLIFVLLDKLKEVSAKYERITEVLDELDLSTDARTLEDELRTVYYDWDCDRTELKALQDELNVLKENFSK